MNLKIKLQLLFFFLFTALTLSGQEIDANLYKKDNGTPLGTIIKNRFNNNIIFERSELLRLPVKGILVKKDIFRYIEDTFPYLSIIDIKPNVYFVVDRNNKGSYYGPGKDLNVYLTNEPSIKGQIWDIQQEIPVFDAVLYNENTKQKSNLDPDGNFVFELSNDITTYTIIHPTYEKLTVTLLRSNEAPDNNIKVKIEPKPNYLEEFTVTSKRPDANVDDHRAGIEKLTIKTLKQLPTFLGEIDPIRIITSIPGVSSSGDLGASFNVRGGESSQNLILQDGALIFNPSHLFGFFSAFNPDMINNVELIKGNGSPKFGGRVASTLNINLRNGSLQDYKASGGVGLVSSRLTLEGPIIKDKASLLVSGRTSYADWLINGYENVDLQNSSTNFNDLYGKLFFNLGKKETFSFTAYQSKDGFLFSNASKYSWQTLNFSGALEHQFNENTFLTLSGARSNYNASEENKDELNGYFSDSEIVTDNIILEIDSKISDAFSYLAGAGANFYKLSPGETIPNSEISNAGYSKIEKQSGNEFFGYGEVKFELNEAIGFDAGLRYVMFNRTGPGSIINYNNTVLNGRVPSILDSTFSSSGKLSSYSGFEPRASVRIKINPKLSVKGSFNINQQFIHQISTSISPSPTDYWVLSSNNIKPQIGQQAAIGVFANSNENKFQTSVEFYYNKTLNVIDYLDGALLKQNPLFESGLAYGTGRAFGTEVSLKKNYGKLSGWVSYTYSRSFKTFKNENSKLQINNGNEFVSVFDIPHQFSLVANYKTGKRTTLSTNYIFNSGRPITIPIYKYSYDKILAVNQYSDRNTYRGPNYSRLDLSLTIEGKKLPNKMFSGDFIFSVYNVLSTKNPYAIWFDNSGQAYKTSVLGTIFPSFTYNFSIN